RALGTHPVSRTPRSPGRPRSWSALPSRHPGSLRSAPEPAALASTSPTETHPCSPEERGARAWCLASRACVAPSNERTAMLRTIRLAPLVAVLLALALPALAATTEPQPDTMLVHHPEIVISATRTQRNQVDIPNG